MWTDKWERGKDNDIDKIDRMNEGDRIDRMKRILWDKLRT